MIDAHQSRIPFRGISTEPCDVDNMCYLPMIYDLVQTLTRIVQFICICLIHGVCNLYLEVYSVTDRRRNGVCWPAFSWCCLSSTGCWHYLLSMKLLMSVILLLHLFASLKCFLSVYVDNKRIGQDNMDLIYIRFTHLTKDNQRWCQELILLVLFWAVDEPLASWWSILGMILNDSLWVYKFGGDEVCIDFHRHTL